MRYTKITLIGLLLSLSFFSFAQVKPSIDRTVHFEISENSANFGAKGGTKTFVVKASDPWGIKNNNVSWCTLKKGEKQLIVTAKENSEFSPRSGYVVLECGAKTIRLDVSQRAAELYLTLSTQDLDFEAAGGTKNLTITTNGDWNIGTSNMSWIHLSKDGNSVTVRIDTNPNTIERSSSFTIKASNIEKQVNVSQKAGTIALLLSQQELVFGASGGTKSIVVTSTNSWSISTGMVSWGHLTQESNSLIVRVDPNPTSSSRTDWFEIKSGNMTKRVNVSQEAGLVTLSLSTQNLSFSSNGGTQTITISTNGNWSVGTDTYSWGHLSKNGDKLEVRVDPNTGVDSRTDYFTIKAGDQEKRVNITQSATVSSWEISGLSCSYSDIASGLSYISGQIKEKGKCRLGAITEYGKGIAIYGDYGYMYSSIPNSLADKIKELNKSKTKINSVTLTNSGYYCVVYQRNGWYGVVPEQMKKKLNEFNANREEIRSVSICENGNFAIVTNEHICASNNSDLSNMQKAFGKYGSIKSVCITNKGICVVCQNGIYYNNMPSNVETKLQNLSFHPDHVTFTDSGTFLITTESGSYAFHM